MWGSGKLSFEKQYDLAIKYLTTENSGSQKLQLLSQNARQLLNIVKSTFPSATFDVESYSNCDLDKLSGIEEVQCAWSQAQILLSQDQMTEETFTHVGPALQRFSQITQEVMSSTASNYDVSRLSVGVLVLAIATALLLPTIYREFSRTASTGIFLILMVAGYGSMMFASSYVEEEQQFWYWICSGWIFYLHMRSESQVSPRKSSSRLLKMATLGLILSQRILRRWNQTGQKFAAEPDIARDFFSAQPVTLWGLVILTYMDSSYHLFSNMPSIIPTKLLVVVLPALAFLFKLNFVANDSPELLVDLPLSKITEGWLGSLSLVWQAKAVFAGLVICAVLAIVSAKRSQSIQGKLPLPQDRNFCLKSQN